MIRSAEVRTDSDARRWEARLNREWPQRATVAAWLVSRIRHSSENSPRIVELACGAGYLAEILLRRLPNMRYIGFDLSPHLLTCARRRLASRSEQPDCQSEISFLQADLVHDNWTRQLEEKGWRGNVDGVLSIQALHDLGGLAEQRQVLSQARELLKAGGVLAYGDLLFDDKNPHSSRYSHLEHQEMLRASGFSQAGAPTVDEDGPGFSTDRYASESFGGFGCFACYK